MAFRTTVFYPPFYKGGQGGFYNSRLKIPLNPPFSKGDFKPLSRRARLTRHKLVRKTHPTVPICLLA